MTNIFLQIINRELPAEFLFENERIIAIKDIAPIAPVHALIIPKKEIQSLKALEKEDYSLIAEIAEVANAIAEELNIADYRLVSNCGERAGQTIFHLHFHLIGGRRLGAMG
jgi:histidine triad (HIT) family protein